MLKVSPYYSIDGFACTLLKLLIAVYCSGSPALSDDLSRQAHSSSRGATEWGGGGRATQSGLWSGGGGVTVTAHTTGQDSA